MLTLQTNTGFYDGFYEQEGYFEWTTYQVYNLPNEDPILVMPVTKDWESLSSGVMLYHQNNVGKKFSYISRADILLAIEQNNPSEIKDIQLDLLVLSDMHRGSGLQEDILINTRDGDEAETPCVGGAFVEFCVRFSGILADFAQEHNNFQSFLGGELENINFQGIVALHNNFITDFIDDKNIFKMPISSQRTIGKEYKEYGIIASRETKYSTGYITMFEITSIHL